MRNTTLLCLILSTALALLVCAPAGAALHPDKSLLDAFGQAGQEGAVSAVYDAWV
jgi:hypothetical protein